MATQSIALFLKEKRQSAGFTQKEVADQFGYSTSQFVSNWERGVSIPPLSIMKELAALYGVSQKEVFDILLSHSVAQVSEKLERRFYNKKLSRKA
jgi:transcriptional regulator with XRE-family HTH domain